MSEFDFYCVLEQKQGLGCQNQCASCSMVEDAKKAGFARQVNKSHFERPHNPLTKDIEEVIADIRDIKPTMELKPYVVKCTCKDCLSGETALQRQLDHQFYKDAEAFRNEIKMQTLKKAAIKYPEPFNPFAWTIGELAQHAMAENYDQQNYIYGLYQHALKQEDQLNEQDAEIQKLRKELAAMEVEKNKAEKERDYWKGAFNGYSGI